MREESDRLIRISYERARRVFLRMSVTVKDVWYFEHGLRSSNKTRINGPNETCSGCFWAM